MGIRYTAYALDPHQTEQVIARPANLLFGYCAHEVWGEQTRLRDEDTLDRDKAWSDVQRATGTADDEAARPAYRMFEGQPTWTDRGHVSWTRVLTPPDVPATAEDLMALDDDAVARHLAQWRGERGTESARYTLQFLQSARSFRTALARDGRGMVYRIG
ncbi:DUF1877 family protein [Janibacter indicus]|uniref:DUF1877 family protein n=1 Tax=Janibacter indicus TaxID=857417 RepID=UPI0013DDC54C|nr:DUF1877 family protein [Janibacter indicus]